MLERFETSNVLFKFYESIKYGHGVITEMELEISFLSTFSLDFSQHFFLYINDFIYLKPKRDSDFVIKCLRNCQTARSQGGRETKKKRFRDNLETGFSIILNKSF